MNQAKGKACSPEKIWIRYVDRTGKVYDIEAAEGDTLMAVATGNIVPGIDGDCGGNCACGTCLIRVEPHVLESLDPPNDAERELLDFLGVLGGNYRLGCQIELTKGLEYATISVAEDRNS